MPLQRFSGQVVTFYVLLDRSTLCSAFVWRVLFCVCDVLCVLEGAQLFSGPWFVRPRMGAQKETIS